MTLRPRLAEKREDRPRFGKLPFGIRELAAATAVQSALLFMLSLPRPPALLPVEDPAPIPVLLLPKPAPPPAADRVATASAPAAAEPPFAPAPAPAPPVADTAPVPQPAAPAPAPAVVADVPTAPEPVPAILPEPAARPAVPVPVHRVARPQPKPAPARLAVAAGAAPAAPAPVPSATAAAASAPGAGETAIAAATDSLKSHIHDAIQQALRYPPAARMMGLQGRARVSLAYRNGAVQHSELVRSAGSPLLDEAAGEAVRAARYPKPPAEIGDRLLILLIWIDFI